MRYKPNRDLDRGLVQKFISADESATPSTDRGQGEGCIALVCLSLRKEIRKKNFNRVPDVTNCHGMELGASLASLMLHLLLPLARYTASSTPSPRTSVGST